MAGDISIDDSLSKESCQLNGKSDDDDNKDKDQGKEETVETLNGESQPAATLSKRALKRLKKREIWEENRAKRRAVERERRKKRAAEDRRKRAEDPEGAPAETFNQFRKRLKKNKMSNSACQVSVVIDCDWEHLMEMKDVQKLAKQIQYAYTTNRRLEDPVQFFVTGLKQGSMLKEKLDKDYAGYENWDIHLKAENYNDCFEKDKIVYLTSESENVLEKLDPEKAYVIGGLVDHNQHKGICHSTAESRGISHARLPIDEFMEMKTRKVLTVNHVFDILASASGGASWEDAFVAAIPSRKGAVVKKSEEGEEEKDEAEQGEEEEEEMIDEENTEYCDEIDSDENSNLKEKDPKLPKGHERSEQTNVK